MGIPILRLKPVFVRFLDDTLVAYRLLVSVTVFVIYAVCRFFVFFSPDHMSVFFPSLLPL